jgi:hypothetical protein
MLKVCSECKRALDLSAFHKNKRRKDGYHEYCKECRRAQYVRRDQPKTMARAAKRYYSKREECLAQMRVRYEAIRNQKMAYGREHYQKNKSKYLGNAAARKKHIKRATPAWFDDNHWFVVQEAYELAQRREALTGVPWDVDHIVPLRGKTVCGLHVKENIAVVPRVVNNFKRTKLIDNQTSFFFVSQL